MNKLSRLPALATRLMVLGTLSLWASPSFGQDPGTVGPNPKHQPSGTIGDQERKLLNEKCSFVSRHSERIVQLIRKYRKIRDDKSRDKKLAIQIEVIKSAESAVFQMRDIRRGQDELGYPKLPINSMPQFDKTSSEAKTALDNAISALAYEPSVEDPNQSLPFRRDQTLIQIEKLKVQVSDLSDGGTSSQSAKAELDRENRSLKVIESKIDDLYKRISQGVIKGPIASQLQGVGLRDGEGSHPAVYTHSRDTIHPNESSASSAESSHTAVSAN